MVNAPLDYYGVRQGRDDVIDGPFNSIIDKMVVTWENDAFLDEVTSHEMLDGIPSTFEEMDGVNLDEISEYSNSSDSDYLHCDKTRISKGLPRVYGKKRVKKDPEILQQSEKDSQKKARVLRAPRVAKEQKDVKKPVKKRAGRPKKAAVHDLDNFSDFNMENI